MGDKLLKLCVLLAMVALWTAAQQGLADEKWRGQGGSGYVCLQILRCGTMTEAQQIIKEVRSGRPFEELAAEYAPEGLKERAGVLGEVQVETLHPVLRKAISTLRVGEIAGPVRTEDGYIVLRLLEPGAQVRYEQPGHSAMDYFLLGLALDGGQDEDKEIELYRKAVELDPNMKEAHVNLGEALRRKGVRLLAESKKGLDDTGKSGDAVVEILDEAIDCFKVALTLDPKMVEAHYNLGLAYAAEGIMGLAVLELQEAAAARPEDGEIRKALASAFYLMGDLENALLHALKAKELKADVAALISGIEQEKKRRAPIQPTK